MSLESVFRLSLIMNLIEDVDKRQGYMEDDQTVTKPGTGASVAGLVIRVDDEGVAVEMGFGLTAPAAAAK